MPNHIHGIIILSRPTVGAGPCACPDVDTSRDFPGNASESIGNGKLVGLGQPMEDIGQSREVDGQPHDVLGQPQGVAPTEVNHGLSLPDVVHRFKTMMTKRYVDGVKQNGWPPFSGKIWQRNYDEHIVRDEEDMTRIREYITNNPARWDTDKENPMIKTGQTKQEYDGINGNMENT